MTTAEKVALTRTDLLGSKESALNRLGSNTVVTGITTRRLIKRKR